MDSNDLHGTMLPSETWYVIQTKPRGEHTAVTNLQRQDFKAFCPRMTRTRRHAGKFTTVSEPLFPSYAFVAIDVSEQPWRRVNSTFGVARLLTDGAAPIPLDGRFVAQLLTLADPRTHAIQIGQDVRLRTGPFAELTGRIVSMPVRNRVRLLLQIMNRDVSVEVSLDDIYLISAAS